jgi:predicted ATPase/DNA-binding SARP family transcriptional activator
MTTLPAQLTAFVGREDEVAEVRRLLGGTRLLTLTGAGGSGKTRLALEVAAQLARDDAGAIAWVELAGLSDPELVPRQVAEQLGLRDEKTGAPTQALAALVRDRAFVLVIDNCEHVVDACARLADALLRSCPRLQILATSREALAIGGERAWLVPSLAATDAVRLFVERARDVVPGARFDGASEGVVREICQRLDHLPLAIELAAARVRVLAPEQILARLHDRFRLLTSSSRTAIPRHQTLRATIDWSYELLSPDEQRLLDRLSAFSGGFTLEAAESVCGGEEEPGALLDGLARLVDRSLVVMRESGGHARYTLLETVRHYAAERLLARGEDATLRRRHTEFFAALVAAAEPHLITSGRRPWLDRVQQDIDNVRQALGWTRVDDPELHLRMAGMLCWFWFSTGYWSEGRRWSEEALALPVAAAPTLPRAAALFAAAVIATLQAEMALARPWVEESIAIAGAHGDRRLEAYARNYLGMILIGQGRAEGEPPTRAALAWFRSTGDLYGLRLSLLMLGTLYVAQRELDRAIAYCEEGVEVARSFGLPRELGIAHQMLGSALLHKGDEQRAAWAFRESLAALRQDPQYMFLARGLDMVGVLADHRGATLDAARLLGAGEAQRERIGATMFQTDVALVGPRVAALRAGLGEEAFAAAWAEGKALTLADAIELALAQARAPEPPPAPPPAPAPAAAAGPALSVRALGPVEIARDGVRLDREAWSSAKAKELLLYLLCEPEGRTREQIGLAFWPEASAAQVKNSFHVLLYRLRKALGRADLIVVDEERYRLNPELAVWFDAAEFERELAAARRDPDRLARALSLYAGDFAAEETVGDWASEVHQRLRLRHLKGLSLLADLRIGQGDAGAAVPVLERLVRADDLREDAHRRLMLCYARTAQRDRALRQYERLVELLREELDAEPEHQSVALAERIRRAEVV